MTYTHPAIDAGLVMVATNGMMDGVMPLPYKDVATNLMQLLEKVRAAEKQIEAEQKAAPVMNAIEATHRATRSDGRPHTYVDPLRAPDA